MVSKTIHSYTIGAETRRLNLPRLAEKGLIFIASFTLMVMGYTLGNYYVSVFGMAGIIIPFLKPGTYPPYKTKK